MTTKVVILLGGLKLQFRFYLECDVGESNNLAHRKEQKISWITIISGLNLPLTFSMNLQRFTRRLILYFAKKLIWKSFVSQRQVSFPRFPGIFGIRLIILTEPWFQLFPKISGRMSAKYIEILSFFSTELRRLFWVILNFVSVSNMNLVERWAVFSGLLLKKHGNFWQFSSEISSEKNLRIFIGFLSSKNPILNRHLASFNKILGIILIILA